MATSTYKSYLMHSTDGSNYEKLIDIRDYPDLGGEAEKLDTTTLSDAAETSIAGIQKQEIMKFTALYTKEDYKKLKDLANKDQNYAVFFGATGEAGGETPSGSEGKFKFKGSLSVFISGKGVNEVREMTIIIAPSTVITHE